MKILPFETFYDEPELLDLSFKIQWIRDDFYKE